MAGLSKTEAIAPPRPGVRASVARWTWMLASGFGAFAGGGLAVVLFPDAAFAHNLIGHFTWRLVAFALTVGVAFGLAQWAALAWLRGGRFGDLRLVLWIPATAAGVLWMLLPLWWEAAEALIFAPQLVLVTMAPGIAFLGVSQWLVLRWTAGAGPSWIAFTCGGAAAGALFGLPAALLLMLPPSVRSARRSRRSSRSGR